MFYVLDCEGNLSWDSAFYIFPLATMVAKHLVHGRHSENVSLSEA